MTDEELKELAKLECTKLLKSKKGYNGLSFQEFWEEGMKYGLAEGRKEQIEKEFHKHNLYVENKRLKQSICELVEKKTELEKETFKLQGEKQKLKQEIEDWKDRCAEIYWDS